MQYEYFTTSTAFIHTFQMRLHPSTYSSDCDSTQRAEHTHHTCMYMYILGLVDMSCGSAPSCRVVLLFGELSVDTRTVLTWLCILSRVGVPDPEYLVSRTLWLRGL